MGYAFTSNIHINKVHLAMHCRHRRHSAFFVGSILYSDNAAKKHPYIAPFPNVWQTSKKMNRREMTRLVAEYAPSVSKQQYFETVNE